MKSQVAKRSIVVAGHKTSVSLEDAFHHGNLSSAIRLFVLEFYRQQRIDQQADPAKPDETG